MLCFSTELKIILRLGQLCGTGRKADNSGIKKKNSSLEMCGSFCEIHEARSGAGVWADTGWTQGSTVTLAGFIGATIRGRCQLGGWKSSDLWGQNLWSLRADTACSTGLGVWGVWACRIQGVSKESKRRQVLGKPRKWHTTGSWAGSSFLQDTRSVLNVYAGSKRDLLSWNEKSRLLNMERPHPTQKLQLGTGGKLSSFMLYLAWTSGHCWIDLWCGSVWP